MDAIRDLSAVTRQSQEIKMKVRSTAVTVREVTMVDLAAFIKACSPFLSAMDQLAEVKETREELGEPLPNVVRKVEDKFGLFRLIGENTDAFLNAAALVVAVEGQADARLFLSRLRPDEFFHIALAVVEVNGDFFILRLAPALTEFFKSVSRIGLPPISASSQLDIFDGNLAGTSTASSGDTLLQ